METHVAHMVDAEHVCPPTCNTACAAASYLRNVKIAVLASCHSVDHNVVDVQQGALDLSAQSSTVVIPSKQHPQHNSSLSDRASALQAILLNEELRCILSVYNLSMGSAAR